MGRFPSFLEGKSCQTNGRESRGVLAWKLRVFEQGTEELVGGSRPVEKVKTGGKRAVEKSREGDSANFLEEGASPKYFYRESQSSKKRPKEYSKSVYKLLKTKANWSASNGGIALGQKKE